MADNQVLIQIRADVADINAKLADVKGYIGKVTDETKRLSDESQGSLGQFKENWVAATAAIVAAWATVNKAVAYMDMGAHTEQVQSSFKIMAESSGAFAEEMIDNMKKATQGTISQTELMQKAVKLMTLGYDPAQIERFSKVVVTASQIAGTSAAEAYDNLSDAIANRMPRSLIRMGAVTREQMVIVTAAIKAGADETELYQLAMANLELKQKMLQGAQDQATISMQQFHAQVQETREEIGTLLITAMQKAYAAFQMIGSASMLASAGIWNLLSANQAFAAATQFDDKKKKEYQDAAAAYKANAESDMEAMVKLNNMAIDNWTGEADAGKKATTEEINDAKAAIAAQMARLKAIADAAKYASQILKSVTDENKKVYDAAIEAADHASKMQVLAGQNELNFTLGTINTKMAALNAWYDAQGDAINKYVTDYNARQAKLAALDADYSKQWQKFEDQKAEKSVQITNYVRDVNAQMYRDINQYSQQSIEAQVEQLKKAAKAKTITPTTISPDNNEVVVAEWLAEETRKVYENRDKAILSAEVAFYGEVNKYSSESVAAQMALWDIDVTEYIRKTKDKAGAEAWLTEEMRSLRERQASDAAAFYSQIQSFATTAFKYETDAIAEKAEKRKQGDYDELAIAKWVEQETTKSLVKMAADQNDFVQGVTAAYKEMQQKQYTWGQGGIDMMKSVASNMEKGFSDMFFDVLKGKFTNFNDYMTSFANSILRTFTDMVAKMVTQWLLGISQETAATNSSGLLGLVGSISSYLGIGSTPVEGGTGAGIGMTSEEFQAGLAAQMGYAKGGAVAGGSGVKDDVVVKAMGGEYIHSKAAVQKYGLPFMEALNRGKVEIPSLLTRGLTPPVSRPEYASATSGVVSGHRSANGDEGLRAANHISLSMHIPISIPLDHKKLISSMRREIEGNLPAMLMKVIEKHL